MIDHADSELVARAIELLNSPPYFNVATESDGQPTSRPRPSRCALRFHCNF
jgi:hypothetical protein